MWRRGRVPTLASTRSPENERRPPSVGGGEHRAPPRIEGTIALAAVLTAVAGFVDAHIFVHVTEVFVANQSGNVVLFGIFLGERRWPEVAAHICRSRCSRSASPSAPPSTTAGVVAGRPLRPDLILFAEAAMLAAVDRACGSIDGTSPRC